MKIGIIGYGGMGQAIEASANDRGHTVAHIFRRNDAIDAQSCSGVDIVYESTIPEVALKHIKQLCQLQQDCVIVTTGWYDALEDVRKLVIDAGIRCLYAANFSIGVNLFYRIVQQTAELMNHFPQYDLWANEIHHKMKRDSPSGTAKELTQILLSSIDRKTSVVEDALQRQIAPEEFHFSSTRGGLVNFGHTIGFDAEEDCIQLSHHARSRKGYARGAVSCGEWLLEQASGLYHINDYLDAQLKG